METGAFAGLSRVSGPAVEPVTVGLARTWLRRGDTSEDTTIGALAAAARQQVEADTGRKFGTQFYDLAINAFPCAARVLELPVAPLQAVETIKLYSVADVETVWSPASYYVDVYSSWPRVCLNYGQCWPTNLRAHVAAVLRLRVGYTGAAIAVSSITRVGSTVTVTTSAAHGFATGEVVTIAGATQPEYNGAFDVSVLSATQFAVTLPAGQAPATPATGAAITAAASGVPAWAAVAIRMRLAQYSEQREGFADAEQRVYDWLIGPFRAVSLA